MELVQRSIMTSVHYSDIYDPAYNEDHMRTRFVPETYRGPGQWAHYEPYGRGSLEKKEFLRSINAEHPLWAARISDIARDDPLGCKGAPPLVKWDAAFRPSRAQKIVHFKNMEQDLETAANRRIDDKCTMGGVTVKNYEDMLVDYVEKTKREERPSFFKDGLGVDRIKDPQMKDYIVEKMGEIVEKIDEDENHLIGLSKTSIKRFPHHFYRAVKKLLDEHCESEEEVREEPEPLPQKKHVERIVLSDYFDNDMAPICDKQEHIFDKGTPENIYGNANLKQQPFKMNPGAAEFVPGSSVAPLAWTPTTTCGGMIENLEARVAILEMLNILPVVEAVQV
tara:strand:+ start:915 stop:1925 length:1011 start_codon:yes stop_codon:yes gene_type:complete